MATPTPRYLVIYDEKRIVERVDKHVFNFNALSPPETFLKNVNDALRFGGVLQGGISTIVDNGVVSFYQSVLMPPGCEWVPSVTESLRDARSKERRQALLRAREHVRGTSATGTIMGGGSDSGDPAALG